MIRTAENRSFEKILVAIRELEAWERRQAETRKELKKLNGSEKGELNPKLNKINDQIRYYDNLTKDMKRGVKPSNLPDLLTSLINY